MFRCIQLAKNGLGTTYPNPLVGSVIVANNKIIGEGWHYKSGLPHAEVSAIQSVGDISLFKTATIYISLEPCSHFGKTPPCADLIIASGIKKVVIGSTDPNPKVAGKGIQKLIKAECDVIVGVLNDECDELNKRFFSFYNKKRPFIILKWAQTVDGFIAPEKNNENLKISEKKPIWITNSFSRQQVHKMRAEEQAILIGTHTVLQDNPSLTTRDWEGNSPTRIILDRSLKIPEEATVFDENVKTIVLTEKEKTNTKTVVFETIDFSTNLPEQICEVLLNHYIQSVIIEGGSQTIQTFIDANFWDEAFVFTGNTTFGFGINAPKFTGDLISEEKIKQDTLQIFKNNN